MDNNTKLLIISSKPAVLQHLNHNLKSLQLTFSETTFDKLAKLDAAPLAVVIDMEMEDAMAVVTAQKEKWPSTLMAGFISRPIPDLWTAAENAGCDLVASRGALPKQFVAKLKVWIENPGGRRIRLLSMNDIAGRLGLVMRLEDSPVGPLAVYHIGGKLFAAQDSCPHAEAHLSEGPLSMREKVITCPKHGSQFDVSSGERIRGPADIPIKTFKVVVEDTQAYLQIE